MHLIEKGWRLASCMWQYCDARNIHKLTLYKDPIRVNRIHSSVKERSSKKDGIISNATEQQTGIAVPAVQRNMITSRSRSSGSKRKVPNWNFDPAQSCAREQYSVPHRYAIPSWTQHATLHESSTKLWISGQNFWTLEQDFWSESNVKTPKLPHQDDRNGIVTTLCTRITQELMMFRVQSQAHMHYTSARCTINLHRRWPSWLSTLTSPSTQMHWTYENAAPLQCSPYTKLNAACCVATTSRVWCISILSRTSN